MRIDLKGKKFIPLRDYVLGTEITEKFQLTGIEKLVATPEQLYMDGKDIPTNKLKVEKVGRSIVESDLVKEGAEVIFDGRGVELDFNGTKYKLIKESNIFGALEP